MIGFIAIVFGTINVVGGFMVTDRMLGMFIRKKTQAATPHAPAAPATGAADEVERSRRARARRRPRHAALHRRVLAVHLRDPPGHPPDDRASSGNLIAAVGMAIAVVTTLLLDGIGNWGIILGGLARRHRGRRDRLDPRRR